MEIRKGTWRTVFLIGPFAIKTAFAGINLECGYIRSLLSLRKSKVYSFKDACSLWKDHLFDPLSCKDGAKYYFFHGPIENWREFWYYLKYRKSNMMPTFFSNGLFSIQRRGSAMHESDFLKLNQALMEVYHRDIQIPACVAHLLSGAFSHHWIPANFCYDRNGNLRMVDYGEPDVLWFLLRYPDFFEPFRKSSK
ncbi:MAG: hypothetical protein PHN19_04325 [Patescibacteria group bacterium]|nr:hypothetical protein [Patescibacteria group bacterium]